MQLTIEQIRKLEAGRELDALVAEKVMGWQWWKSSSSGKRCFFPLGKKPSWFTELSTGNEPLVADFESTMDFILPNYSTDIAAAWSVVEKMRVDGYRVRIIDNGDCGFGFEVRFYRFPNSAKIEYYNADNVELAICRAALIAVTQNK